MCNKILRLEIRVTVVGFQMCVKAVTKVIVMICKLIIFKNPYKTGVLYEIYGLQFVSGMFKL